MRQPFPVSFIPPVVIPRGVLLSDASSEKMPGRAGGLENQPRPRSGSLQGLCFGVNVGQERVERSFRSSLRLTAAGQKKTSSFRVVSVRLPSSATATK